MPCRYGDEETHYPTELEVANSELDKLTRMLCEVMGKLDKLNTEEYFKIIHPDISGVTMWWMHHKEKDKKQKK